MCVSVTVVADWMGDNLRCVIVRTLFILISKQMGYEKIALLNLKGQLILKCPFGVFKSSKKNEFFSRISALASKKMSNQKTKALY